MHLWKCHFETGPASRVLFYRYGLLCSKRKKPGERLPATHLALASARCGGVGWCMVHGVPMVWGVWGGYGYGVPVWGRGGTGIRVFGHYLAVFGRIEANMAIIWLYWPYWGQFVQYLAILGHIEPNMAITEPNMAIIEANMAIIEANEAKMRPKWGQKEPKRAKIRPKWGQKEPK